MWVRPSISQISIRRTLHCLLGLGLAGVAAPAWGQSPPLGGSELPLMEVPATQPGCVEYWIASSRECSQRMQTRCPQGTLRYFAADAENRLTDLTEPAFLASLNFDVPICFVIHGDLTSFQDILRAAPPIVKWIRGGSGGQPVQVVFYTWPSDDVNTPLPELDISSRGERAEFNGCYLATLISQFPAQTRVSFFGHSFGARVTSATLHLLAGGTIPCCQFRCHPGAPRSYRAVFIAAAMDRDWLNPGERYGRALFATEWLLNIRNGADIVINLYPLRSVFSRQALGRVGFSPRDRLRMGALAGRVTEWDATLDIGPSHAWAFYYRRPEIATIMAPVLVYSEGQSGSVFPYPPVGSTSPNRVQRNSQALPTGKANPNIGSQPPSSVVRDSTRSRESSATRSGL